MHRSIRETRLVPPPIQPRIAIDIVDLAGRMVATATTWDGIIDMLATLPAGEYQIVCSAGRRLAIAVIDRHRGPTIKFCA